MSAEPVQAGLSRAQRAIAETYEDLCFTLESVRELTDAGSPDTALRLVNAQRDALDDLVEKLAGDVAILPRRRAGRLLRARSLVAAALMIAAALSGLVVSRGGAATPELDRRLARAERIADPRQQLTTYNTLYRESLSRPQAAGEGFRSDLIEALDEFQRDEDNRKNGLAPSADKLASAVRAGDRNVPPPPAGGEDPIDVVRSTLDRL